MYFISHHTGWRTLNLTVLFVNVMQIKNVMVVIDRSCSNCYLLRLRTLETSLQFDQTYHWWDWIMVWQCVTSRHIISLLDKQRSVRVECVGHARSRCIKLAGICLCALRIVLSRSIDNYAIDNYWIMCKEVGILKFKSFWKMITRWRYTLCHVSYHFQ